MKGSRSSARRCSSARGPSSGLGERIGIALSGVVAPLLVGPLRRYRPIHAAAVAHAMVQIAKEAPRGPNVFEYDGIIAAAISR